MNIRKISSFVLLNFLAVLLIWLFENSQTLSFIFPFLISACLCIEYLYCGKMYSLVSLFLVGVFSVLAFDGSVSIIFSSVILSVIGVVVGILIQKKAGQPVIICFAALGYFILYVGTLIILSRALGENAVEYTVNLFKPYFMEAFETSLYSMRMEDMFSNIEDYLKLFIDSIILLMPSILIIISVVMGYVLLFVVSVVLKLIRSKYKFTVLFSKFKADGITIFIYFVSMIVTMFISNSVLVLVFQNIHTILQFILQICGLSLADAYFVKKGLPLIPRIIVVMVIFFASVLPVVSAVLVIMAAFDANRDFRGLNSKMIDKPEKENNDEE